MQMAKFCGSSPTVKEGDDNSLLQAMEEGRVSEIISPDFMDSVCNKIARTKSKLQSHSSISGREAESTSAAESTILRIPDWLHNSAIKHLYEPFVVSIGPHHRNKPHLQEMQEYKWLAVSFLFPDRPPIDHFSKICIETCLEKLKGQEDTARSYYDKNVIKGLSSDEFLEMMLTDGCFIIVFFLGPSHFKFLGKKDDVITAFDEVMDDLLLMDNQIPFSILRAITGVCASVADSLRNEFAYTGEKLPLFWKIVCNQLRYQNESDTQYDNLLDVYHFCIVPDDLRSYYYSESILSCILSCFWCLSHRVQGESERRGGKPQIIIHSASNLQEKGVIFKKANIVFSVPEMTFSSDGTIKIPCISIEDVKTMNLLAFEQWKYGNSEQKEKGTKKRRNKDTKNHMPISVTIYFIASMVKTSQDLELLENCGIIEIGTKYNDETAMEFFKMCTNNLQLNNEEILHNLSQQINKFMNSRRSQWRAKLMKDYFSNPWSILSLLAALMLLVMTFVQTYCSMASYLNDRHPHAPSV